ncbi:hypothetical protein M422DRAFT_263137 [Sphaerobolus stellatus SS14]|uniref:Uncharacterized protein n=1 Tax=Sphaerobolus stellatus (strain SS14) TaxID=990650 RepID=A0A0C9VBB3_SPHS4|nr:hypothetical protein M422DRAFT_263137 [Sphaerobolus stellatus SS14]
MVRAMRPLAHCTYHLPPLPSRPSPSPPRARGWALRLLAPFWECFAAKWTPGRVPCTHHPTCTYRLPPSLPVSPTRSLRSLAGSTPASPHLGNIALQNGHHGVRHAPAAPTTSRPCLPAPLLAPQSSLAGSTLASTFLGVLCCETVASGMCVRQSPPAPTTSRPPSRSWSWMDGSIPTSSPLEVLRCDRATRACSVCAPSPPAPINLPPRPSRACIGVSRR